MKPDSFRVLFATKDSSRSFGYVKLNDAGDWWGGELISAGRPLFGYGKPTSTRKLAIAEAVARATIAGIDTRRPGESDR